VNSFANDTTIIDHLEINVSTGTPYFAPDRSVKYCVPNVQRTRTCVCLSPYVCVLLWKNRRVAHYVRHRDTNVFRTKRILSHSVSTPHQQHICVADCRFYVRLVRVHRPVRLHRNDDNRSLLYRDTPRRLTENRKANTSETYKSDDVRSLNCYRTTSGFSLDIIYHVHELSVGLVLRYRK